MKDINSPIFVLPPTTIESRDVEGIKNILDLEIPYWDSRDEYSEKQFELDIKNHIPKIITKDKYYNHCDYFWQSSIFYGPIIPIMVKKSRMVSAALTKQFDSEEELDNFAKDNKTLIYCIYREQSIIRNKKSIREPWFSVEEASELPRKTSYILRYYEQINLNWLQFKLQKLVSMQIIPRWVKVKFFKWCCTIK